MKNIKTEIFDVKTKDNVTIRLSRLKGGRKGPVVLAHGLGVSSTIFTNDAIKTNLATFLCNHSYDVWLLDLRFSIQQESAKIPYSADDSALYDYPAAIEKVREVTGSKDVQVVAHCYGSTTFTMAILAGLQGVRSAVCSQIGMHIVTPFLTRLKSYLFLADILGLIGVKYLTASTDRKAVGWEKVADRLLKLYPVPEIERCDNPACKRVAFLYAPLYKHKLINNKTHDDIKELFGIANILAFKQLALMVRKGYITDHKGRNIYLPEIHRMAIPLRYIHGEKNDCFLPESTEKSYKMLCEKNGEKYYSRRIIPNYGHIDCIFGENAAIDVYPHILEHLEAT